jgi:hypothetical protein
MFSMAVTEAGLAKLQGGNRANPYCRLCCAYRGLIGVVHLLDVQDEVSLVIEVHELGCHLGAESVAFTAVAVKNDLHGRLLFFKKMGFIGQSGVRDFSGTMSFLSAPGILL